MSVFLSLIAAYLLGCFNTGYYLVRLVKGVDIRGTASGNTGSRNVGRMLGTAGFLATFAGDAGKGALTVWLGLRAGLEPWHLHALLLVVVAGHVWPVQLGFKGGKGFATLAGGLPLVEPLLFLSGLLLSLLFLALLRRSTISGLSALACSPVILALIDHHHGVRVLTLKSGLYCLLTALILHAHRANIRSALGAGSQP